MPRQSIQKVSLCTLLLVTQFLVWGCASHKLEVVAERICGAGLGERVESLEAHEVGDLLARADAEGGAICWSEAVQLALEQDKSIPKVQLTKAIDAFNRNATASDFHRAVGQYLRGLAGHDGSYTEDDRRLLEAYSRYVIRTARSQDDANLHLAQTACARLDRVLYARLFE
jgi:hypothetical protein